MTAGVLEVASGGSLSSAGNVNSISGGRYFQNDTSTLGEVNLVVVPEPGAIALAAVGLAGVAATLGRPLVIPSFVSSACRWAEDDFRHVAVVFDHGRLGAAALPWETYGDPLLFSAD